MYLYARLFGVGLYFISLIITCWLLNHYRGSYRGILTLYLFILCLMSFFFVPNYGNDLYRLEDLMKVYASQNMRDFITYLKESATPVAIIYMRLIGYFGIPSLLPAITTFICYGNIFYVFKDYIAKNNFSNKSIAITLLIIMCNSSFFETISGIRTMLVFSIFIRCYYNENYNSKSFIKNFPLYIIACLIHQIGIIIFAVRMLELFVSKFEKITIKSVILISLYLGIVAVLLKIGFPYIEATLEKGESYIIGRGYNYFWENALTVCVLILVLFIQTFIKKRDASYNGVLDVYRNKRYSRFFELITIIFSFEHNIFFRINNFNLLLNIPVYLNAIEIMVKNKNKSYTFIIAIALFILSLSCIRGNLCSLKFWE